MEPNDEKRRSADPSIGPLRSLQDDIFKKTLSEVQEHSRLVFENALKLNQEAYRQVNHIMEELGGSLFVSQPPDAPDAPAEEQEPEPPGPTEQTAPPESTESPDGPPRFPDPIAEAISLSRQNADFMDRAIRQIQESISRRES